MKKLSVFLVVSLVLCTLLAACAPTAPTTQSTSGSVPTTLPTSSDSTTKPTDPEPTNSIPTGPKPTQTRPTTSAPAPTEPKPTEPEYEDVVSSPDFLAAMALAGGEKQKPAEDITIGKFTFGKGCYFESNNDKYFTELPGNINTQKKDITVVLAGSVNSMKFDARGASSGGCVITVFKEGVAEAIYTSENLESGTLKENIELKDLEPGTYVIKTSGSARIGDFTVTERMEKAEAVSIAVKALNNKVLMGRPVSADGISVELVYANGRRDVLDVSAYTTNLSELKLTSGKHTVTVTHTATGFQANYELIVYAVESVRISDYSLDSKRVTHPVQKIYLAGSSYDNFANAAVIATCTAAGVEGTEEFVLQEGEYTFAAATEKNKRVIAYIKEDICNRSGLFGSYAIEIISVSQYVNKQDFIVDAYAKTIGEGSNHYVTVSTINDALWLYELLGTPENEFKNIILCEGTYNEKVDINIPNLSIRAEDYAKPEKVVVVYNALNGLSDPSGTTSYSTDGSATFSVRESAKNFRAQGFTIMNYYNTHERYEESKLIAGSGTQAVACLVRADKVIFEEMRFSSYQDTLYAENGRHVYKNCYIEGRTDYIFGNNATAYFDHCTIHTLYGADEKNGGYVVTTKGGNSAEHVKYGFIFDGCVFEADENVTPGTVSIARGWDKYMMLAILRSNIDGSYSLEAYGDTSSNKNDRYTKMNADPVAGQIFEFSNMGEGALTQDMIDSAVDGVIENLCTVLTFPDAMKYWDMSIIFAAENGTLTYPDDWSGR